jgi:hypothetical protein
MKLATRLHLVPSLNIGGTEPSLPHSVYNVVSKKQSANVTLLCSHLSRKSDQYKLTRHTHTLFRIVQDLP